jgi:hypothetical protein
VAFAWAIRGKVTFVRLAESGTMIAGTCAMLVTIGESVSDALLPTSSASCQFSDYAARRSGVRCSAAMS